MGKFRPLFVYFRHFLDTISIIQIEKSVDEVLGIQTRGRRMVGADETTELWRPPILAAQSFSGNQSASKQELPNFAALGL